ncbi:MAG: peptidase M20, partial [Chloroflexi bacterium]
MTVENVLADLIRIQTVNPPGGETEVARYLKRLFDQYNIPNEIIEPKPGRGSFLAYLGEGERSLLYLSHTDVVTATEGWSFAPFSGEIKEGFVHGRGALDCKGLVAAEACAMIELARKAKLGGRLVFAATADEETLGPLGMKYLIENCQEKIRVDFAINEGAEAPARIGGKTCHFLAVGEKGPVWAKLKARGSSAHGSLPMLG